MNLKPTRKKYTLNSLCKDIKEIEESKAKIQNDLQLLKNDVSFLMTSALGYSDVTCSLPTQNKI